MNLYRPPFWLMLLFLASPSTSYAGQHPTRVDENTNCLECHSDKTTGHVHAAVKQGCGICHSIDNHADNTEVGLRREGIKLCLQCHPPETYRLSHFPYSSGPCIRCHEPHASSHARLLRASVNDLCLKCHLRSTVSDDSRYLPTIALIDENRTGHPFAGHPVSGVPDPLTGEAMSCVSCHLAHGGNKPHLLRMGSQIPEDALNQNVETKDMCSKCHMAIWGMEGAARVKKTKRR